MKELLVLPSSSLHVLEEALHYSMFPGGKRIRAILMILIFQLFSKKDWKQILPSACAIEMVHLASLLLDDLPCMDNATLRRGKATCHRIYGESNTLLATVGLLNLAFHILHQENQKYFHAKQLVQISQELSHSIGFSGMIGGQYADLQSPSSPPDLEKLEFIHSHKTSSLFIGSLRIAALLAGAKEKELNALTKYGKNLGLAYQIKDDLLDQEGTIEQLGKDIQQDQKKCTFVSFCGKSEALVLLEGLTQSAIQALEPFGKKAEPLIEVAHFLAIRDY
jgi:geranylgeranyl diphosphate synthase type II